MIKAQASIDFFINFNVPYLREVMSLDQAWSLYVDGASWEQGMGINIVLKSLVRITITQLVKVKFKVK